MRTPTTCFEDTLIRPPKQEVEVDWEAINEKFRLKDELKKQLEVIRLEGVFRGYSLNRQSLLKNITDIYEFKNGRSDHFGRWIPCSNVYKQRIKFIMDQFCV